MISEAIKEKIRAVAGPENVFDSDLERFAYSYDASFVPLLPASRPDIVVRPRTTEEVAQLMALACEYAIPVTPRGAASGRTGGSIPLKGGMVISLDRMTRILELDEKNMTVTAEAGVRTADLYECCAAQGLFYPPDPASWKFSTIGGNVAENAGGMRAVKYGVTSDYVMGLQVVLADGTVLETGGKAVKNVTGYDLKRLFTGSEGTLGIITRVLLRLIPMPKERRTLRIMFGALADGCEMIHKTMQAGIVPAAAEIMDRICLDAVSRAGKMRFAPESGACIVMEIDGESADLLTVQSDTIGALSEECRAVDFRVAGTAAESDELWAVRREVSSAVASLAPHRIGEDISVPRDAFPEVVRRIGDIAERNGLVIAVYGHAGDGNLHPSILCDLDNAAEAERAQRAVQEIFEAALNLGGTLSGEHGIGVTKRPFLSQALGEAGVRTMQALKQALDPQGILNPGKIW